MILISTDKIDLETFHRGFQTLIQKKKGRVWRSQYVFQGRKIANTWNSSWVVICDPVVRHILVLVNDTLHPQVWWWGAHTPGTSPWIRSWMIVGSCKCHTLTGLWFHYFLGVERDQCHCYWNPRWQGRSYCHILSRKSEERYLYQFTIYHAVRKNMSKGKVNNLRNWNLGFRVFYLFLFFSVIIFSCFDHL